MPNICAYKCKQSRELNICCLDSLHVKICLYNIINIAIQYNVSFNAVFTGVMETPIYIYTKDLAMFSSEEKVGSIQQLTGELIKGVPNVDLINTLLL